MRRSCDACVPGTLTSRLSGRAEPAAQRRTLGVMRTRYFSVVVAATLVLGGYVLLRVQITARLEALIFRS